MDLRRDRVLRTGFVPGAVLSGRAGRVARAYRAKYPQVQLETQVLSYQRLIAGLRSGELDVAVLGTGFHDRSFASEHFAKEVFVALLPVGHKLTKRQAIPYRALSGETLVALSREAAPELLPEIAAVCAQHGCTVRSVRQAPSEESVVGLVAAGAGVAIAPDSWAAIRIPGVVCRPLKPYGDGTYLDMFYRAANESQLVASFLEIVREMKPGP